ncbi:MAG: type II toxin-antitoxin system HigB family toxin [Candidatus Obscuribacterales bacterium]|nr:type II toxin-antitoxin system HigB family toxin [Candidatus Obscuribacterales bacterium]
MSQSETAEEMYEQDDHAHLKLSEMFQQVAQLLDNAVGNMERGSPAKFFTTAGTPTENLLGTKEPVIGVTVMDSGEAHVAVFANGRAAQDRETPELLVVVSRTTEGSTVSEVRHFFEPDKGQGDGPTASVTRQINKSEDTATITACVAGQQQTVIFKSGIPSVVEVDNDGGKIACRFTADGKIGTLEVNGQKLNIQTAGGYLLALQQTVDMVATENGFPQPPRISFAADYQANEPLAEQPEFGRQETTLDGNEAMATKSEAHDAGGVFGTSNDIDHDRFTVDDKESVQPDSDSPEGNQKDTDDDTTEFVSFNTQGDDNYGSQLAEFEQKWRDELNKELESYGLQIENRDASKWRANYDPHSVSVLKHVFDKPRNCDTAEFFKDSNLDDDGEFGGGSIDLGITAHYFRKYMSGKSDLERTNALDALHKEVLGGDNRYALDALKLLALVDATRKLELAKTPQQQREALKALAGLHIGAQKQEQWSAFVKAYVEGPDGETDKATRKAERQALIKRIESEVKEEQVGARVDTNSLLISVATTKDGPTRDQAMKQLENQFVEAQLRGDEEQLKTLKIQMDYARAFSVVQDLTAADSPDKAMQSLNRLKELSSKQNNLAAFQIIRDRFEKVSIDALIADLKSPDAAVRSTALKQIKDALEPAAKQQEELRRKSPAEILGAFCQDEDPERRKEYEEAVKKAIKEMEEFAAQNLKDADGFLGKYLDRNSDKQTRTTALDDLSAAGDSRLRALRSSRLLGAGHLARAAEAARTLHEDVAEALTLLRPATGADRKALDAAAQRVKADLLEMTDTPDGRSKNPEYSRYVSLAPDDVARLVKDLNDPQKLEAALTEIEQKVGRPDDQLNEMRVARVVRELKQTSSSSEFQKACDALSVEVKAGNKNAAEWLEWTKSAKLLADLNECKDLKAASESIKALTDLARLGNSYAKRALSAFLLSDCDQDLQLDWYQKGNCRVNGKPLFVPDKIAELARNNNAEFTALKNQAIEAIASCTGRPKLPIEKGDAAALAISLAYATDKIQTDPKLAPVTQVYADKAAALLNRATTERMTSAEDGKSYLCPDCIGALAGLTEILSSNQRGRESLIPVFLRGTENRAFYDALPTLRSKVLDGDKVSIEITAAIAGGTGDFPGDWRASSEVLQRACLLTELRGKIIPQLLHSFSERGDKAHLLEALGGAAANEKAIPDEVRAALQKGIASSDQRTHRSAVEGLMKTVALWTEQDLETIKNNLSPDMVRGIEKVADAIPEQLRAKLLDYCVTMLDPRSPAGKAPEAALKERLAAVDTIKALARYVQKDQVDKIAQLGDLEGLVVTDPRFKDAVGAKRLSEVVGLSPAGAQQLQTEAGKALLHIMMKTADSGTKAEAFDAFAAVRWPGVGNDAVRQALVSYAKGLDCPPELVDQINKIVYDANLPMPVSAVFRHTMPGLDRGTYQSFAAEAIKNCEQLYPGKSGEITVRGVLSRAETWNSLDRATRRDLTGSDKPTTTPVVISPSELDPTLINRLPLPLREQIVGKAALDRNGFVDPNKEMPQPSQKVVIAVQDFNNLPPELRKQLTGRSEILTSAHVTGLLVNGELKNTCPFLLPDFFNGKSLEDHLKTQINSTYKASWDLRDENRKLESELQSTLKELCKKTKDGPAFSDYADSILSLGGLIDDDPLDKWAAEQKAQIDKIRSIQGTIETNEGVIAALRSRGNSLDLSCEIGRYEELVELGRRREADQLAAKLLASYGPDLMSVYAPKAYKDLVTTTEGGMLGRSGLQRLADHGLGTVQKFPDYLSRPPAPQPPAQLTPRDIALHRADVGLTALKGWDPAPRFRTDDVYAYRSTALKSIDCHPGVNGPSELGRTLGRDLSVLKELAEAARGGTKYEGFVSDCKERAKNIKEAFREFDTKIQETKQLIATLRNALPEVKNKEAREALEQKIKTLQETVDKYGPGSKDRISMDKFLNNILSRDFNESTFCNWFKENAIVIGATLVAAGAIIATFGAATPFAVVMIAGACTAASQGMKEILYQVNNHIYDTGWGKKAERSAPFKYINEAIVRLDTFVSAVSSMDDPEKVLTAGAAFFLNEQKRFFLDVTVPVGFEFGMNLALGYVCVGAGSLGRGGVGSLKVAASSAETRALAVGFQQAARSSARTEAGQALFKQWLSTCSRETGKGALFVTATELTATSAEKALKAHTQEGKMALSFISAASIAFLHGRCARNSVSLIRNEGFVTPEAAPHLISALKASGNIVRPKGNGTYEVIMAEAPNVKFTIKEVANPVEAARTSAQQKPTSTESPPATEKPRQPTDTPAPDAKVETPGMERPPGERLRSATPDPSLPLVDQLSPTVAAQLRDLCNSGKVSAAHMEVLQRALEFGVLKPGEGKTLSQFVEEFIVKATPEARQDMLFDLRIEVKKAEIKSAKLEPVGPPPDAPRAKPGDTAVPQDRRPAPGELPGGLRPVGPEHFKGPGKVTPIEYWSSTQTKPGQFVSEMKPGYVVSDAAGNCKFVAEPARSAELGPETTWVSKPEGLVILRTSPGGQSLTFDPATGKVWSVRSEGSKFKASEVKTEVAKLEDPQLKPPIVNPLVRQRFAMELDGGAFRVSSAPHSRPVVIGEGPHCDIQVGSAPRDGKGSDAAIIYGGMDGFFVQRRGHERVTVKHADGSPDTVLAGRDPYALRIGDTIVVGNRQIPVTGAIEPAFTKRPLPDTVPGAATPSKSFDMRNRVEITEPLKDGCILRDSHVADSPLPPRVFDPSHPVVEAVFKDAAGRCAKLKDASPDQVAMELTRLVHKLGSPYDVDPSGASSFKKSETKLDNSAAKLDEAIGKDGIQMGDLITFKRMVCFDQAIVLKAVMEQQGFNVKLVTGQYGKNGHAWCEVQINGKWYIFDPRNAYHQKGGIPVEQGLALGYETYRSPSDRSNKLAAGIPEGAPRPPVEVLPPGEQMKFKPPGDVPAEVTVEGKAWKPPAAAEKVSTDLTNFNKAMESGDLAGAAKLAADVSTLPPTPQGTTCNITTKDVVFDLAAYQKAANSNPTEAGVILQKHLFELHQTAKTEAVSTDTAGRNVDASLPRSVVDVNGVRVNLATGEAIVPPGTKRTNAHADAESAVAKFKDSVGGKIARDRILAEQALSSMMEKICLHQELSGNKPFASSYAEFVRDMKADSGAHTDSVNGGRHSKLSAEQEALLALYESGWNVAKLEHHFANHRPEVVRPVFEFLRAKEALRKIDNADTRALVEAAVQEAGPFARRALMENLPDIISRHGKSESELLSKIEGIRDAIQMAGDGTTSVQQLSTNLAVVARQYGAIAKDPAFGKIIDQVVANTILRDSTFGQNANAYIQDLHAACGNFNLPKASATRAALEQRIRVLLDTNKPRQELPMDGMTAIANRFALDGALCRRLADYRASSAPPRTEVLGQAVMDAFVQQDPGRRGASFDTFMDMLTRAPGAAEPGRFKTPDDLRKTFGSNGIDPIPGVHNTFWVDVGGNNYRVMVRFDFVSGRAEILMCKTHAQYDKVR